MVVTVLGASPTAADAQVLVERAAGECVGEVALIEDTPRTATLRAKESCVFMTMVRAVASGSAD